MSRSEERLDRNRSWGSYRWFACKEDAKLFAKIRKYGYRIPKKYIEYL